MAAAGERAAERGSVARRASRAKRARARLEHGADARAHRECKRKWCNYTGRWDLGNSKALIGHTFARALSGEPSAPPVPYGFELGNELCGQKGLQAKLEPAPFAADYARLRQMIDALWRGAGGRGAPPHIAGPACELQPEWYRAFVKAFRPDALTHHAYLLGSGRMESLREKVLDPDYLNRALFLARNASDVASALRGRGMLWAGEAGGAYNSGQHYVTDTFLSNFWFLDELGTFAAAGHHVFCRQTLVGGNYGLLNSFHRPLPDFWAALLWRALMGAKVLRVKSGVPTVRAYAHCARRVDGSDETDGRVSLLLLNLAKTNPAVVDAFAAGRKILSEQSIYLVTSPSLDSIEVKLNGETLQTDGRGAMPTLRPRKRPGGTALVVPPLSYMFVVMAVEQFGSRGVCGDVVRDPIAPVAQLNDRLRAVAVQLAALVDSGAPASAPGAPGARAADAATATAADAVGGADALASGVEAAVAAAADDGDSGDSVEGFFADDDDSVAAALLGDGGGGADEGVAATPPPTGASAALGAPAGTPIRALIGRHAGTPIRRPARQSDASRLLVVGPVCGVVTLGLVLHSSRARSLLRSLLCSRKARVATRAHTT